MNKKIKRIASLFLSLAVIIGSITVGGIFASAENVDDEIKNAVKSYVASNGNATSQSGLITAVQNAIGDNSATIANGDFYIKYAVDGVKDKDTDPETQLNIPGSDGAVAVAITVDGNRIPVTVPIKHNVEVLELEKANIGSYDDSANSGKKIINWIGNNDTSKNYKLVLPENTSYIRTDNGLTLAGGTFDNIKAIVMKGHRGSLPQYTKFKNIVALQMSDNITVSAYEPAETFKGLSKLKYVKLSTGITWIRRNVFENCTSLINVGPFTNVSSISSATFANTAMKEVTIPAATTLDNSFYNPCGGARNITRIGETLSLAKTAAYAAATASEIEHITDSQAASVKSQIEAGYADYVTSATTDWNGSYGYDESAKVYSGVLTVSDGTKNFPIEFSAALPYSVEITEIPNNGRLYAGMTALLNYKLIGDPSVNTKSWSSDNTDVVVVDPNSGIITAVSSGTATITFNYSDTFAKATITVYPQLNSVLLGKVAKHLLGVEAAKDEYDCNFDGEINLLDLVRGKKLLADFNMNSVYSTQFDSVANQRISTVMSATDVEASNSGTVYYVSESGSDSNSGKSSALAIKTLNKLSSLSLSSGDTVLFERGGEYNGKIIAVSGVTYGAYGNGNKPVISYYHDGSNMNDWVNEGNNIWKLNVLDSRDTGNIVFDNGKATGNFKFSKAELKNSLDFTYDENTSYTYVYCTQNPATLYSDIRVCSDRILFNIEENVNNVTIDNIAFMYAGGHAIRTLNGAENITVRNCEIAFIGGSVLEGTTSTRYGNGLEIWQGGNGITVENCYIHDIYDSGLTHQGSGTYLTENITFKDNLIERCGLASIEYWHNTYSTNSISNVTYENNIMRFAGYGFGGFRTNRGMHIYSTGLTNDNKCENFTIENNIFDVAYRTVLDIRSRIGKYPTLSGNTYAQYSTRDFGYYRNNSLIDFKDADTIISATGDTTGSVVIY